MTGWDYYQKNERVCAVWVYERVHGAMICIKYWPYLFIIYMHIYCIVFFSRSYKNKKRQEIQEKKHVSR